jgi:PAS domain S-box-containing protein
MVLSTQKPNNSITVLHVDDNSNILNLTEDFLEREDNEFVIETATSADNGLDRIRDSTPDCVVSDYDMPGKNGIEFLQSVREEYPDIPFILFTGKGSEAIASEAISAGVTDYLQKKSGAEQYELLANRITNAVEARRTARSATRQAELMRLTELTGNTGGWELDLETGEFLPTSGARQFAGVSPEETFTLEEALDFVHPDDREGVRTALNQAAETGEQVQNIWRIQTAQAETKFVDMTIAPATSDGDVTTLRGAFNDITDQKIRERKLAALNRTTQRLLRANSRQEVAKIGIEAARDILGLQANAIHFSTPDERKLIPAAQTEKSVSLIGDAPTIPVNDSIAGRIYRSGEPTVIEDVHQDSDVYNADSNLKGHFYLPLEDHGILIAGSEQPAAFDKTESTGAKLLAGNIVAALDRIERAETAEQYEKRLSLFFEESPLGAIQWDEKFRFERLNQRAEEILGYSEADLRGGSWEQIVEDTDRDPVRNVVEELLDADGGEYIINKNVTQSGEIRTCEWHNKAVTGSDGDVRAIFSQFRDITDRERRKQQLEEYGTILKALNDAVYVLDEEGRFTYVNDEFVEMVGYERERILGSDPSLIKDESAVRTAEDQLGRLLSSDGPEDVTFEVTIQPREGDPIICEDHMCVLPYEGDSFEGSVGMLRDVTPAKERERQLEQGKRELEDRTEELETLTTELEEQYRHLFEEAPVMAVVTRAADGRPVIKDCNDLFVETLGYEKSELIDKKLEEFYTANSQRKLLDEGGYERALTGEFVHETRELVTANGETVETLLRAVPREDTEPDSRGTLAFYVDISERKRLERQRDRLEEFTRIVSHDLRSPLTVANGHIELAQQECDSDQLVQAADAITRSQALIDNLLRLAREGETVTESEPVKVEDIARRSWKTVETAHATLETEVTTIIEADRSRLQQLFENLYRNAVEHGGDRVTVLVGELDSGFYVADTGAGIPESDRNDIFEAGYSTTDDGTGFGLRIVEQIAEAHGWEIQVTEGTDGGARFEITGVKFTEC